MAAKVVTALVLFCATPATAQIGVSVSAQSDERYRGRSLSDGRPVAALHLSYDDATGVYAGGSVTAILTGVDRAGLMATRIYGGYARTIDADTVVDVGVIGHRYTDRYSGGQDDDYVEGYAGLSRGGLAGHLRFTPSYFGRGYPVVYVDVGATRELSPGWRADVSAGVAIKTTDRPGLGGKDARYDLRVGIGREWQGLEIRADLTFGGPDDGYFDGPAGGRSALVLGISRSF